MAGRVLGEKSPSELAAEPSPALVHLLVSHEEHHVLPFFSGLPFVTQTTLGQGDYIITANDRPLLVVERKRDDDLATGIKSGTFRRQRDELTRVAVAPHQVYYLREAIPRWASPSAHANMMQEETKLDSAQINSEHRDGFRWGTSTGILHTVYLLLRRLWAVLCYGDSAWTNTPLVTTSSASSASLVSRPETPYVIPPPVIPVPFKGGKPSENTTRDNFLALVVSCVPGASYYLGLALLETYGTISEMCAQLRSHGGAEQLENTEWMPERGWRQASSGVGDPVGKRRVGKVVAARILNLFGVTPVRGLERTGHDAKRAKH
jgi:hypothetical protein